MVKCNKCSRTFKNARGLQIHEASDPVNCKPEDPPKGFADQVFITERGQVLLSEDMTPEKVGPDGLLVGVYYLAGRERFRAVTNVQREVVKVEAAPEPVSVSAA